MNKPKHAHNPIQVSKNAPNRNVAENALKGFQLYKTTIVYGINGSGKSTVCETLKYKSHFLQDGIGKNFNIHAFDKEWIKENVGDFIEGGSADGITTIRMGKGTQKLEEEIRRARKLIQTQRGEVERLTKQIGSLGERKLQIINEVFKGERSDLSKRCDSLEGRKFNRRKIEEILETNKTNRLTPIDVSNYIEIANQTEAPLPISIPELPDIWVINKQTETELMRPPQRSDDLLVDSWIKEGLERHKVKDACELCGGIFTNKRKGDLEAALVTLERENNVILVQQFEKCKASKTEWRRYIENIDSVPNRCNVYQFDFTESKSELKLQIKQYLIYLTEASRLLEDKIKDFKVPTSEHIPTFNPSDIYNSHNALREISDQHSQMIRDYSKNRSEAIETLQIHCCSVDGTDWNNYKRELKDTQRSLTDANRSLQENLENLKKLQHSASTTAEVADFIEKHLAIILGSSSLKVATDPDNGTYVIRRGSNVADAMSEGERKIIAALYFLATLKSQETEGKLSETIILMDDVGSEIDDSRLMMLSRIITNEISGLPSSPAAIVHFTHSEAYFKILRRKLNTEKLTNRKAGVYEVFKNPAKPNQNTEIIAWRSEPALLVNDYWLAFYMLVSGLKDLTNGKAPHVSVGNFSRKAIEAFTEFKAPGSSKVGVRVNALMEKHNIPANPALSELLNTVSHGGLTDSGGILSHEKMRQSLIGAANFIFLCDRFHFDAMLEKFVTEKSERTKITALVALTS